MKIDPRRLVFLAWCIGLPSLAWGGVTEHPLVRQGQPAAALVDDCIGTAVEAFAGTELQSYVQRITGAWLPRVRQPKSGHYSIRIATAENLGAKLPEAARKRLGEIRDDGFLLHADASGLYVVARDRRGLCFGVYEILGRFGGVRWISPGPEGEFIPKMKTLSAPAGTLVCNPSFRDRRFNLVSSWGSRLTPLWQLRNGMTQELSLFGGRRRLGGHIFSALLPDTLFGTRPELFGLFDGRRLPQCGDPRNIRLGGQANQPCTSNPETVRIMQENLVKMLKENPDAESFVILNNDSGAWCQCENCRKLDPPGERRRHMVSTRFWLLANALVEAGKRAAPHVRFIVSAYQNFQEYPEGVAPDPRAEVDFCVHHRCYVHSMGDQGCWINERYRRILARWHEDGRKVRTYEYTDCLPQDEVWYLPLSRVLREDLRYYHRIGNAGWCDEVAPYDGNYITKSRTTTGRWIGSALDLYLMAALLWNVDADYHRLEEEAGTLYYGPAWPPMRRYRHLLADAYEGINDHFVYGTPFWRLGRIFEPRGLREQLERLLAEAQALAAGDARVSPIVSRDREFFRLSMVRASEVFQAEHRANEIRAGERGEDEGSWRFCDWAHVGGLGVRFQYGPGRLYLRHQGAGAGAELEILIRSGRSRHPVAEPGELSLPVPRTAPGESVDVGLVLHRGKESIGWNGAGLAAPGVYRRVMLGDAPIIRNGNFAVVVEKDGRRQPEHFSVKGKLAVVTDGTAASGRNFLRGNGFVFQYLNGLRGPMQTYGIPKIFRGGLVVRVRVRGEGRFSARLCASDRGLRLLGEKTETLTPAKDWRETAFRFDCSGNQSDLLLLYVFSSHDKLDLDDIRVETEG